MKYRPKLCRIQTAPPAVAVGENDVIIAIMKANPSRRTTQDALRAMYDPMLRRIQTRKAKAGMQRAFDATPSELGRAAVEAGLKGC